MLGSIKLLLLRALAHQLAHLVNDSHLACPDALDGLVLLLKTDFALFSRTVHIDRNIIVLLCMVHTH